MIDKGAQEQASIIIIIPILDILDIINIAGMINLLELVGIVDIVGIISTAGHGILLHQIMIPILKLPAIL